MASVVRMATFPRPPASRLEGLHRHRRRTHPFLASSKHRRVRKSDLISVSAASQPSIPSAEAEALSSSGTSHEWVSRTAFCGDLGPGDVGRRVRLCGWAALIRTHGGLTFLNLRDHSGIVQVTTIPDEFPEAYAAVSKVRLESVVAVEGFVRTRPDGYANPDMITGDIEVAAENLIILNSVSRSLPFPVTTADDIKDKQSNKNSVSQLNEEIRLRFRVLDLRRHKMQSNMRLRHKVVKLIRRYLEDRHNFVEIETPVLSRSTPEGARDYIVPSRVQAGSFYALPQSPQLFKQMLMASGFDRYYQIARCFRDEDLRADRQPEFTQLDMELAFTPFEEMLKLNEDLIRHVFKEVLNVQLPDPFPRLTYAEAMNRFGTDRPDLRFGLELKDVSDLFMGCNFKVFSAALEQGGIIKALCVPCGAEKFSNTDLKKGGIFNEAVKSGAKGLPFLKVLESGELGGVPSLVSSLHPDIKDKILVRLGAKAGSLVLFALGSPMVVNRTLDRLRLYAAHEMGLLDHKSHSVLWVTDFPMFEWNDEERRYEALHHPFTAPNPNDMNDLSSARALAYDMVYNGVEIGGGSLRIYKREVQQKVFEIVGISPEQAEENFGYLLESFDMGAPPHGGIAYGLDRLVMLLAGSHSASSIRDVIAFPKTTTAQCALTRAPSPVDPQQLRVLSFPPSS